MKQKTFSDENQQKIAKVNFFINNYSFGIKNHSTRPRHGCPSCRGAGSAANHILTLVGDLAGEAWRQPGCLQGQRVGPMMGDTPYEVVARRACPSGVASLGRVTHAPADPTVRYDVIVTSVLGGAREPQSGFPDGAG